MTFAHASATWQPSPRREDPGARRPAAEPPRRRRSRRRRSSPRGSSCSETTAATGRTLRRRGADGAARGRPSRYRDLKAELGVIDYGDQIDRAIDVVRRHPDVVADHRARFEAVLLDEYQDTNVAQAELMEALFGDGHPVTAVGDPDQNIYAWRGASLYNLLDFPRRFPTRRRPAGRAAAAVHELPVGLADPGGRRPARSRPSPPRSAPPRTRSCGPGRRTARARSTSGACSTSGPRRPAIADRAVDAARRRVAVVRDGGALPHVAAVRAPPTRVRGARGPGRDPRARGAAPAARGRRGPRVRAGGARPARPRWRSRGSCSARATASGSRTSRPWPGARRSRRSGSSRSTS